MEQWFLFLGPLAVLPVVYLPTCPLAQRLGGRGSGDASALTHAAHCPLVHVRFCPLTLSSRGCLEQLSCRSWP